MEFGVCELCCNKLHVLISNPGRLLNYFGAFNLCNPSLTATKILDHDSLITHILRGPVLRRSPKSSRSAFAVYDADRRR